MKRLCFIAALAALLWMTPAVARAQGCILCRDSAAGAPAKLRAGLRRGILVLGLPAGGVFAGILILAWRIKPKETGEDEDRS